MDTVGARDPALGWFSNLGKGWAFLAQGKFRQAVELLQQTEFADAPLLLAIAYVYLDRLADAREQVAKMLKTNPTITQTSWRGGYSFRDQNLLDGFVADLARAGLPEK